MFKIAVLVLMVTLAMSSAQIQGCTTATGCVGGYCLQPDLQRLGTCICPNGFAISQLAPTTCSDINECLRYQCGFNVPCVNTIGSYYCNYNTFNLYYWWADFFDD
ncbi:hypothetical protein SNE40_005863 [Patella caerulea]|uniref:Uncharacterized protein n=1 Tax=Patella caerulea TaxID=87958 RepID=A0AAN8Q572_PATCE